MDLVIQKTIYHNEANHKAQGIEKETYELLDDLNIKYHRVSHESAATINDCLKVEQILDVPIYKNLLLRNSAKTQYFFLVMMGHKRFVTKNISKQIGSTRLSFVTGEETEVLLGVTKGSLSILALFNDRDHRIQLLMDEEVYQQPYFGCHPCDNRNTLKIKTQDVLHTFLGHTGHKPIKVCID